jgi:hypothetical protein
MSGAGVDLPPCRAETPPALRIGADHARWLALGIADLSAIDTLRQFADELDALALPKEARPTAAGDDG